jgi:hypothetical protein
MLVAKGIKTILRMSQRDGVSISVGSFRNHVSRYIEVTNLMNITKHALKATRAMSISSWKIQGLPK